MRTRYRLSPPFSGGWIVAPKSEQSGGMTFLVSAVINQSDYFGGFGENESKRPIRLRVVLIDKNRLKGKSFFTSFILLIACRVFIVCSYEWSHGQNNDCFGIHFVGFLPILTEVFRPCSISHINSAQSFGNTQSTSDGAASRNKREVSPWS